LQLPIKLLDDAWSFYGENMNLRINGRVAIVTVGSERIGKAAAVILAE